MKAVLITFDQSHYETVMALLDRLNCRGYTFFEQVQGRGSRTGEPHLGSHAWPAMNSAVVAMVDEARVRPLLDALHEADNRFEQLGLRAFVWNIEQSI